MNEAQTSLGKLLQRTRMLNRLTLVAEFLKENNRNELADSVREVAGLYRDSQISPIATAVLDAADTPVVHDLKCDPACYASLAAGIKKAEVRYDDRGYHTGDVLHMMETKYSAIQMTREDAPLAFTGQSAAYRITHIQRGYGLPDGMVVLSVEPT